MRYRYLGSRTSAAPPSFTDAVPRYAILPMAGGQANPLVVTGDRFVRTFTPDALVEAIYRVKIYHAEVDYTVNGSDANYVGDSTIPLRSFATNEPDIIEDTLGDITAWGSTVGDTGTYTQEIPPGSGPSAPITAAVSGTLEFCDNSVSPPYYYNPTNGLYMPDILMELTPAFTGSGVQRITTIDLSGDPSYNGANELQMERETISFLGTNITVSVVFGNVSGITYTLAAFSVNVFGYEWWEYRDGAGNNPIWNSTTGASIISHKTLED